MTPAHDILYLGCGDKENREEPGLRIDVSPATKPDILHDLNQFPWPLPANVFKKIVCHDVLEHLENLIRVMEEIHRIAKPGAIISITLPHFSSSNSYTDPTHRHHLGIFSFDYFCDQNQWGFYTPVRFKKIRSEIHFHPNLINKIIWRIAKKNPKLYEERLTWMFPAWFVSFELEVIK